MDLLGAPAVHSAWAHPRWGDGTNLTIRQILLSGEFFCQARGSTDFLEPVADEERPDAVLLETALEQPGHVVRGERR